MNRESLPKGIYLSKSPEKIARVWGAAQQARLATLLDILPDVVTPATMDQHADWLEEVEVAFGTWGFPLLTAEQLDRMPRLKAVFYAAGSVKAFAPPLLDRGITVVSAWAANAIPVAEFTLSQILFSLKLGYAHLRQYQNNPSPKGHVRLAAPGAYGATVGIISLGMIGRKVSEFLRPFEVRQIACDPFVGNEDLQAMGVHRASLEEVFAQSDVVTLHAPILPETEGMITGRHLASMKPNATFINTARGILVKEDEMIEVLRQRPDLTAILDVTFPEPAVAGSPLYELENVVLLPHIAGSWGNEFFRMADYMVEEFVAWKEGRPLRYAISREMLEKSA